MLEEVRGVARNGYKEVSDGVLENGKQKKQPQLTESDFRRVVPDQWATYPTSLRRWGPGLHMPGGTTVMDDPQKGSIITLPGDHLGDAIHEYPLAGASLEVTHGSGRNAAGDREVDLIVLNYPEDAAGSLVTIVLTKDGVKLTRASTNPDYYDQVVSEEEKKRKKYPTDLVDDVLVYPAESRFAFEEYEVTTVAKTGENVEYSTTIFNNRAEQSLLPAKFVDKAFALREQALALSRDEVRDLSGLDLPGEIKEGFYTVNNGGIGSKK